MNPIALIEATAVARSAVLGALATDPVVPGRSPLLPVPNGALSYREFAETTSTTISRPETGSP